MADSFKFPDEQENTPAEVDTTNEADVEIEIVDDTPERDRGRKPLEKEVADPTDDEIESYSDGVKKRISELTHARHDERRAKEALLREKQELERVAQYMAEENKRLKEYVSNGEQVYAGTLLESAQAKVEAAKRVYKEAVESYDPDQIVEAQTALNEAQWNLAEAKKFKPTPLQERQIPVNIQPQSAPEPSPDPKALAWRDQNRWFGQDEEMTSFALGLHTKLIKSGIDPSSDEYYARLNSRIRQVFPENFGLDSNEPEPPPARESAPRQKSNVDPARPPQGH